jgi:hypothetical protein
VIHNQIQRQDENGWDLRGQYPMPHTGTKEVQERASTTSDVIESEVISMDG